MNEFLEQFLIESREFAEQATAGLLQLERSPQDAEQLDAVFRAVHTLKGGAGIVDFLAMERAVHAAEDLLSAARARTLPLNAARIGDCLACIDQVLQWLDTLEQTGELPTQVSEAEADRIVARFGMQPEPSNEEWIPTLLSRHPYAAAGAVVAVRWRPDAECFYQGEDPVARLMTLPGLLALDAGSITPWPPLASLEAFRCNLLLTALSQAGITAVGAHMNGQSGECDIQPLGSIHPIPAAGNLPASARKVLEAQRELIAENTPSASPGHTASAARTVANVLRSVGRSDEADDISRIAASTGAGQLTLPLLHAIARLLSEAGDGSEAAEIPGPTVAPARHDSASRTLRIDAARIDVLVRLTGELTIAKNAVSHLAKVAAADGNPIAPALKTQQASFDHLVGELQRAVLGIRVLPMRVVFQRFPRILRDMSADLGRPVSLTFAGEDTEADKTIVEMLFEPLLHVVRNALDHGVERPAQRAGRGKPPIATIEMRAMRQGDQVVVEVADDGGGIDAGRIREVALARGIATEDNLRAMNEADLIELVFAPGFSTASQVTALSGRGVGMDAVRNAVERIGGRVNIRSQSGLGTTIRFMLPFSVMMTKVMSVEAGGQMFGVPLDTVVETIRVPRSALSAVGNACVVIVRDLTIPVFELATMLGVPGRADDAGDATLVIAAFAGQRCGLQVDALGDRLEVMLKPLDGLLAGMPGITGTTLLGDGRVLLVLDIGGLLQ